MKDFDMPPCFEEAWNRLQDVSGGGQMHRTILLWRK